MKNFLRILLPALALPVLFISCEKRNNDAHGTGIAEFSVSMTAPVNESSPKSDSVITALHLLISVTDLSGNPVFTDKLIPLYAFGTSFMSENLQMESGDYRLIKFLVMDPAGKIIHAAPVAGSEMAYLVMRPLPLQFRIAPDEVTRIAPEVLSVGDLTPEKFGYAAFGIQVIKPLEFWTYCIIDNPLWMRPILLTQAKLTISTPSGWRYSFRLAEKLNHLIIRGGSTVYYFLLEKDGYTPQRLQFTAEELRKTTADNPLVLKIPYDAQVNVIELQPGPRKGIDAMVSNLGPDRNFGDYKYFETTFLSEPLLTVMRSNRSLLRFDLDTLPKSAVIRRAMLTLSYDIPVPFDPSYATDVLPSPGIRWYGAVLQQIVEPWDEYKVTWNTVPKTIERNQVYLPPFIRNVNRIEIDVTRLFTPIPELAVPNYGMLFRLWPDDQFPGFRFASSDYPEANMRPKLKIFYTIN
jgi:hypothetical protein